MLEVITRLDPEHWSRREPGMVRQFTVKPGRVGRHPTCGRCLQLLAQRGIDVRAIERQALAARDWPESPD